MGWQSGRRLLFAAVVGFAATAGPPEAPAGEALGVFARNGDKLTSQVVAGDEDAYAVRVSEGGSLTVSMTGKGGLLPSIRVLKPDGTEVALAALLKGAGKPVVVLKNLAAAAGETGTWQVLVGGANGTAGTCRTGFTVRTPTLARTKGIAVPAGMTAFGDFTGDDGATATVTVVEKLGGPLVGARVLDPDGVEVAGSAALFTRKKKKLISKPIPLASGFGRYRVELTGGAEATTADVSVKLKFAKIAKRELTLTPEVLIGGVSPAVVRQGQSGVALAVTGSNFPAGTEAAIGGTGVTVAGFSLAGATDATVSVDAADDAPYGPRDLTLCPPELVGEPITLPGAITVAAPDPTVTVSSLFVLRQGESGVLIEVGGTGFRDGGALSVAGAGVTVGPTTFVGPGLVRTTLSAASGAAVGPKDVTYTQPAAGGGDSATLVGAFALHHPAPTLSAVSTSLVKQGQGSLALTLTGTNFRDGGSVAVTGGGITVSNPVRNSDTSFTVTLSVASSALFGLRDVVYTQPAAGGGASATLASALTVAAPDPTIASIAPGFLRQGDSNVTLTVAGTGFRSGGVLAIGGTGLTVGTTTVVSDSEATVIASASGTAPVGTRDVTFTQPAAGGGASVTSQNLLAIHDPVPVLTSVTPSAVRQGDSGVVLVLDGDHFRTGGAVTVSGTGLTLSNPTRVSDTRFEVTLGAASDATLGTRDVTYTQPAAGGGAAKTLAAALQVSAPDPTVSAASPISLKQAQSNVTVTVTGTNFRSGGAITMSGTGLTLGATTFVSETQATVPVTVASDATFGARDVTWTQPAAGGGASATKSSALSIAAPTPTVTAVSPATVQQAQPIVTLTVTGTNFRSGGALSISGTGLTLGTTEFVSETEAEVTVDVASDASFGARDVTWTQPAAGGGEAATKTSALTVLAPTPAVTAVSPTTLTQGATDVTVTVDGSGFRSGGALTISGPGLTVGATTFVSSAQATVVVSAASDASFGARDVTWTQPASGGGAAATKTGALTIVAPTPTVTSASPVLRQGQTNATLTVDGTSFRTGGAVTVSGTGITLGTTTFVSDTRVTVAVSSVDDAATVGKRSVTYTQPTAGGGASGTGTDVLTVNHPDPTVTAVSPNVISQGDSGTFAVTGTGFRAGFSVSTSATGVTLSNPSFTSATSVTVDYSATGAAALGLHNLTYTQPSAGGGASATRTSAFEVKPPAPTVTSVTPSKWLPGATNFTVQVVGSGFNSGTTVTSSGTGVTIVNLSSGSPATAMTLRVSVASNASVGARDITITPGSGGGPAKTFTSLVTIVPADPVVTAFSHPTLAVGASNVSVAIDGQNFRSGDTVEASGSGVSFSSVTFVDSTRLTATAAVTGAAATGKRTLTVKHGSSDGGGSGSLANAFEVIAAAPTVTAIDPGAVGLTAGALLPAEVPVTITGTNFMAGATASVSLTGASGLAIVSGSEVVASATTMTARLTSSSSVGTGKWNVVVTNPGSLGNSGTTGNALLTVNASNVLTVNNVVADSGGPYGGERITIYGAGFSTGDVVDFGAVRAFGTHTLDANTCLATVPLPASASSSGPTRVDVKVTDVSGVSATRKSAYAYGPDDARFVVRATFPGQGATGVPETLRRVAVLLSGPCDTSTAPHPTSSVTNSAHSYWATSVVLSGSRAFDGTKRWLVLSRPTSSSLVSTTHTINIPGALKALSGLGLIPVRLSQFTGFDQYSFTPGSGVRDGTAPAVSTISPADKASGVDPTTKVVLVFSEEIDPLTVTPTNILFQQAGKPIAALVEMGADLRTVTITPETELAANATYTTTVTTSIVDFSQVAFSPQASFTFTTSSSDATAPTIDRVIVERLRSDLDGSGTYTTSTTSGNAFDVFLPRSGFLLDVRFSDAGGSGIDATKFSATCSSAVGGTSAGGELASNFAVTPTGASWRIPSKSLVGAGEDVKFTFTVKDLSGNSATSLVVNVDVVDKDTTATGNAATGHAGGDHDPFDGRQTVVLRADLDRYTVSYSGSGTTNGATTTVASDNASDFDQSLRYIGLGTGNMKTAAAATVNGPSVGTNDIVARLVLERIRETLRLRYGIAEDGTRNADSVDVEFLLPGEQGSLSGLPAFSSANSSNSANAYSELSFGGTVGFENVPTTTQSILGQAWLDTRNLRQEANLNLGTTGQTTGIYLLGMFKVNLASGSSTTWRVKVLDKFVTGFTGAVPVGESDDDDEVLSGSFDRTAAGNTAAQNARYDAIQDAIEVVALYTSAVAAHEIGHSSGLVADGAPKTGLFGNAHFSNSFTEATSSLPNTSFHMNAIGNDLMAASTDVESTLFTGSDFKRFSGMDIAYLLNRLFYDEGR